MRGRHQAQSGGQMGLAYTGRRPEEYHVFPFSGSAWMASSSIWRLSMEGLKEKIEVVGSS